MVFENLKAEKAINTENVNASKENVYKENIFQFICQLTMINCIQAVIRNCQCFQNNNKKRIDKIHYNSIDALKTIFLNFSSQQHQVSLRDQTSPTGSFP